VIPVEFHPDAAREANDAVDYYDEHRAALGDEFRPIRSDFLLLFHRASPGERARQCPVSGFRNRHNSVSITGDCASETGH